MGKYTWPKLPQPYTANFENNVRNTIDSNFGNCADIDTRVGDN